ncbi:FecR domain-containing protein [Rugamonas sp. CCM 8940]|uniref:FecR family protein n=1 Tax=Rugamonas sp. CCM 8940 TaxID=2765359 RepID=UPI001F15C201|nr:FecR family protein [Rugamonas sp. CCM 8940]
MSSYKPRQLLASCMLVGLAGVGAAAHAAEAARIVFVAGAVHSGARALLVGDAVQEGDEIATGAQGYVYLKTVDNGLLILRPGSRARIVTYHVDRAVPANTQIKFELLSGVARSVSGDAVKLARQNFRFNTPVAAIGVRGTDFTVSTDQETSRVTVISGAIVVSGFNASCLPGGSGPCEHPASRELAANQAGQMLQVRRGQAAPQLMNGGVQAPDAVAPPRSDEPSGKSAAAGPQVDVVLDPQKSNDLLHRAEQNKNSSIVGPTVNPAPNEPVVVEPSKPPVLVVDPPKPPSQLVWGRWQSVLDQAPQNDNVALTKAGGTEIGRNAYYTVYRTAGAPFVVPTEGVLGFVLKQSEAVVTNSQTKQLSAATLEKGELVVNFGQARFNTSFDLVNEGQRNKMQAAGAVQSDGALQGDLQFYKPTNMNVKGGLSADGTAAYVFDARLDEKRTVSGVTGWSKAASSGVK